MYLLSSIRKWITHESLNNSNILILFIFRFINLVYFQVDIKVSLTSNPQVKYFFNLLHNLSIVSEVIVQRESSSNIHLMHVLEVVTHFIHKLGKWVKTFWKYSIFLCMVSPNVHKKDPEWNKLLVPGLKLWQFLGRRNARGVYKIHGCQLSFGDRRWGSSTALQTGIANFTCTVSCMYINTHWLEIQVERRESNISLDESVESTEDSEFDSEATVLHSKLTEEEREALKPRLKAGHHQLCFLLIFFSLQHYPIMGVDKILAWLFTIL